MIPVIRNRPGSLSISFPQDFDFEQPSHFLGEWTTPAMTQSIQPVSGAQKSLLLLHHLDQTDVAYNMTWVFGITTPDHHALTRALDKIVTRHEPLRTTFLFRDSTFLQVIEEVSTPPAIRIVDLADLREAEQ